MCIAVFIYFLHWSYSDSWDVQNWRQWACKQLRKVDVGGGGIQVNTNAYSYLTCASYELDNKMLVDCWVHQISVIPPMRVQMQSVNSHFPLGSCGCEFARKIEIGHRLGIVLGFTTSTWLFLLLRRVIYQIRNSNC